MNCLQNQKILILQYFEHFSRNIQLNFSVLQTLVIKTKIHTMKKFTLKKYCEKILKIGQNFSKYLFFPPFSLNKFYQQKFFIRFPQICHKKNSAHALLSAGAELSEKYEFFYLFIY